MAATAPNNFKPVIGNNGQAIGYSANGKSEGMVQASTSTGTPGAAPGSANSNYTSYNADGSTTTYANGVPTVTPAPAGRLNAVVADTTNKKADAPTVITSDTASKDLANKQNQINQLNQDIEQHKLAMQQVQPQSAPDNQGSSDKQNTQQTSKQSAGALDDQIQSIISGLAPQTKAINDSASQQTDAITAAQTQQQNEQNAAYSATMAKLQSITQGTYPLSPAESALVSSTASIFQNTISAQQTANKAYTGQMTELMASLGINTSAPTQSLGEIQATIDSGNEKVSALNAEMSQSLAQLQMGFQKQDFDQVQTAWADAAAQFSDRNKQLQDMLKGVQDAAKEQVDQIQKNSTLALTAIMDSNTISYQEKQLALSKAQLDETTRHDMAQELAADPNSPQAQGKLFNQGVSTLRAELSNRSGGLGLQDAKVNQAIHLKNLFDQYKTTKQVPVNDGSLLGGSVFGPKQSETVYNIPPSAYTELAIGVANLVSGTNTVAEGTINNIKQATAQGDLGKALTYATGQPFNGSSQEVLRQLKDSVDRQAITAEGERQTYVNDLLLRLPPGLSAENTARLTQSSNLNSYYTPKEKVDSYIQANPTDSEAVAKLYDAGWTDQDVADYLNQTQ